MLTIKFESKFKKELKKVTKRGKDMQKLEKVMSILANEKPLPLKYRDHVLVNSRNYKNVRECHIEPDWLLIYRIEKGEVQILRMIRTGTHSDLY